jgi:Tfp pilus assembly protein PilF
MTRAIRFRCKNHSLNRIVGAAALGAAALLFACDVFCAAHEPASDDVVLERLPPAFLATRNIPSVAPSTNSTSRPDLAEALATAKKYIEVGQTYSDPRAYGYAQAALGSWWDANPAPASVLIMRARILQFRHEFKRSLAELEAALKNDQFQPDAWLLLASIEQVQGNVAASRAACLKLIPMADPLVGATCVASTIGLTDRAKESVKLLSDALSQTTATSPQERTWAWTTLAEIRARVSDDKDVAAEDAFKSALAIEPADVYARAAYADFLLDENRNADARQVLGDATQADALLLRAAIAAKRENAPDAPALEKNLAERFAEARERGDQTHLREQARFTLEIEGDVPRALDLAQRNFEIQREPADARILLEAALASHNPNAAQAAIDWLKQTAIDAPRLRQLAASATQGAAG